MKVDFKDSPSYKVAFHSKVHDLDFYEPATDTQYHMSRYVAAGAQNIYSAAGLTPDLIGSILGEMEKAVNANKLSDVAVWINNLKYRLKYPCDEDASLRMGLIYFFIDGEDPNAVEPHWMDRKLKLVKEDPEAYSFFMKVGLRNTKAYTGSPAATSPTYFQSRREQINELTPSR